MNGMAAIVPRAQFRWGDRLRNSCGHSTLRKRSVLTLGLGVRGSGRGEACTAEESTEGNHCVCDSAECPKLRVRFMGGRYSRQVMVLYEHRALSTASQGNSINWGAHEDPLSHYRWRTAKKTGTHITHIWTYRQIFLNRVGATEIKSVAIYIHSCSNGDPFTCLHLPFQFSLKILIADLAYDPQTVKSTIRVRPGTDDVDFCRLSRQRTPHRILSERSGSPRFREPRLPPIPSCARICTRRRRIWP
jgi:hypothetical protein